MRAIVRAFALSLSMVLIATPILAEQGPAEEKGFRPEKMYNFGSIDEVNTFNGNLVVTTPIGISLRTRPFMARCEKGLTCDIRYSAPSPS